MVKKKANTSYQLVKIDQNVLDAVSRFAPRDGYMAAGGRKSDRAFGPRGLEALSSDAPQSIALGDVVSVAIYETDSRIFGPSLTSASGAIAASPVTALPPQPVDQSGEISVPFVGRVRALGRMPGEVESQIREGLRMKTADPQVVVTVSERVGGNLVSVAGDVQKPAQVPIPLAGAKLVDAIAGAGGSLSAPYDTMVTVTRGSTTRSDLLQGVYDNPSKNIALRAGDTVILRKRALSFSAFGATGKVGAYPIIMEDLSLSDAVAASGGPSDLQANPATIFLYREEPTGLLEALGKTPTSSSERLSPVIYQLDLTDPSGFFYANNFSVRDRDILFYASSGSVGVNKFMSLLNTLLAPAATVAGGAATVRVLSPGSF